MPSNQGSEMIHDVFDDVGYADLKSATRVMWQEVHAHGHGASCECPAIELLCALYERGYRLVRDTDD